MNKQTTGAAGVDRPSNVAIARWLATLAANHSTEPTLTNYEQGCMEEAADALQDEPPRISDALSEAEDGVAHAWRGTFEEVRFEAWACAAVAALLRDA